MTWYAAHIIMQVQFKEAKQYKFPVWENVFLIEASSDDDALRKAEEIGESLEGDSHGTFLWEDIPSKWVFRGVKKLNVLSNPADIENKPGDGCEVTYTTLEFSCENDMKKFVNGEVSEARILD
jgi:hypothetical protein